MNKEQLKKRLEDLTQLENRTLANYNAILGAKEDCNYWLGQLENEETLKQVSAKESV